MEHHINVCRNYARRPTDPMPPLLEALETIKMDLHEFPDAVPMDVIESYRVLYNGLRALFEKV